ncbi:MAG: thioredoxin domain-containing protein [Oscillatoria sp. PMC 1068.18]|nr:thioredoxin domain-containing protein [Oscillatoria sp. PMC 1076.18]MEC4989970.1 thioredoxin domain-containing protein [Oscillatoria sp. PMC 1068.18]
MLVSVSERNFSQEVLESNQPVLVHFWTPWCGLCKRINPLLDQFQLEWDGQVKVVGINPDENFKLASQYRLTSLPTLLMFDRGTVVERIEGFQGREELKRNLEKLMVSLLPSSA